jgi:endonuclease/exonuclease/phosphatase family metal-dependent hydrolase
VNSNVAGKRKRKRPSKQQRRRRQSIAMLVVTMLGVIVWAFLGPQLRERGGLSGAGPPPHGDEIRVVTWNLENFAGSASGHDVERMREIIERLDPDVLAVQEIKDPEALAVLLPGWEIALSSKGGRGHQLLGVAVRPDRVALLDRAEHPQLSLDGHVRPAFSAYLRAREGGPDFWLVVVHLKAMPDAIDLRRKQWPLLAELARDRLAQGPSAGDHDLLIVGDFNTTGPVGAGARGPEIEQAELAQVLAAAGLRRMQNAGGCTAYYDGQRRDAWKEPSEIDLVWVRDMAEALEGDAQVHSGTHCAEERCRDFRSTEAYPVRDFESVSDHCPVVIDLARADDDD